MAPVRRPDPPPAAPGVAPEPVLAVVDGRFEVLSEVGRGGLGIAFLARDRARGGERVALKVVRDLGDAARALLEAEYRALARLAHPAVPPAHDVGVIRAVEGRPPGRAAAVDPEAADRAISALRPGAPFIAREFVEGEDLFVATRGRSWDEVRPLVVALARALAAVHARGLTHGDLKPGNVLVPRAPGPWPVRLIDLGPGETVEYLAPERIRGAPPDRRSDLFALGATLYRVLSGELPFTGRTTGEVARAVLETTPVPLAARVPALPPAAAAAVSRLLERARAARFASAAAFLRAIGEPAPPRGARGAEPAENEDLHVSLAAAPLAGREAEVDALVGALDLAAARPRVVLVEGGPGTGKSRLLAEAALEARLRGLRVAQAAGRPGAPPFAAFHEAIPELSSALAQASGTAAPDPARADPGAVLRALDALASRILALAAERPTAVVIDDLDRAGDEDRALAALLARRLASGRPQPSPAGAPPSGPRAERRSSSPSGPPGAPLVLVAATHPDRGLDLPGTRLRLGDVAGEALPALVRGGLGPIARGEAALLAEVARRGAGNPGLVEAVLRDLAASRALVQGPSGVSYVPGAGAGAGTATGTGASSPMAGAAVPSLLKDPAARAVALALAVIGRPAPIGVVAAAAGLAPEDALEGFARLAGEDLALATGGRLSLAPGRVALEAFPAADRRAADRAAAAALIAAPDADPAEIGRLLARAGDPAGAAPHLLAAARRARGALALGSARALFGEAAAAAPTPELRAEALAGLGETLLVAGSPPDAAAKLAEAVALGPGERADRLLLLARAEVARGDPAAALARLADARAAPGADLGRADLIEGIIHLGRGDLKAAAAALRRALDAARDPRFRAAVLGELAGVEFRRGAAREATNLLVEAARIHRAAGDIRARATDHARLGHTVEALGDRAGARRHHLRAIRLYRVAGDRAGIAAAWGNLGNLLEHGGDLAGAERLYLRSARLKRELGVRASRATTLMNLGVARLMLGRPADALRACRAACAAARATGEQIVLLQADTFRAEALAALGRFDEALRLARSIRRRERARPPTYGQARSEWAFGHILLARGDAAGAVKRFRRAERFYAKVGHPVDLLRIHELMGRVYRRLAGLEAAPAPGPGGGGSAGGAATEVALAAERSRTARLLAAATALATEADARRVLERVCEDAVALLGAERAFIVLRREDGRLDFAVSRNFELERVLRPESKAPHALLEAVLAEGRPIASTDALRDQRLRELTSVQLLDVRSVLAVPIRDPSGGTVGALYVDHRLRPGGFGEGAAATLEALAAIAASALSRARLAAALRARDDEAAALRAALDAAGGGAGDEGPAERPDVAAGAGGAAARPAAREAFAAIVGRSRPLRAVLDAAARVAAIDLPVLILGESGTGKELLARAIHLASPRRGRPFVAESCAALPESLLESELFGHVRGAFTGADRDRSGLFELASGGTLFLDEIGDTTPALQAKLLRALQEGEVRPVGATATRRVDVRVIAATNRDLDALRRTGAFRDDLFFRLGGATLVLPPLRERPEDIPALAERFLADAARRTGRRRLGLEPEAAAMLRAHRWPGNVRELEHAIRAAALFAERGRIGPAALRAAGLGGRVAHPFAPGAEDPFPPTHAELRAALDDRERAFLGAALDAAGGNRARAAAAIGLSRYALNRVLRRLGLDPRPGDPPG